jgi:DNA repair protein RadC
VSLKRESRALKRLFLKETGDVDRPYERCLRHGPSSLSDAQLLAVILRTGTKGTGVMDLSEKILKLSQGDSGLLGICHLTADELMTVPGIGEVKAVQILCVGELSRRISTYRARRDLSFTRPETIADYFMERLRHEERENLILMMLDTKGHLIGEKLMTVGTVNASLISPREVFMEALKHRAVSVILLHNHPSGDPEPSSEDRKITEKMKRAGELLEIRLLDHVVIGDRRYVSFAERGLL